MLDLGLEVKGEGRHGGVIGATESEVYREELWSIDGAAGGAGAGRNAGSLSRCCKGCHGACLGGGAGQRRELVEASEAGWRRRVAGA
jgi:hypothetical protein